MRTQSADLARSVCELSYQNREDGKEIEFNPICLQKGYKKEVRKTKCCDKLVPETQKCNAIWCFVLNFFFSGTGTMYSAFTDS